MFKKILIAFIALIAIAVGVVALQPGTYRVERSKIMAAPPQVVFEQVNDFHHWEAWSPWAKLDPAAKNSFEGPDSGKGAIFRWAGNKDVGEGSMTILESRPNEFIRLQLDFIKPFKSTAMVEFRFEPHDAGSDVYWIMSGNKNFISKAVCMFSSMDKMVGGDFERGLANMEKAAATQEAK